jgi:hypothetical protein
MKLIRRLFAPLVLGIAALSSPVAFSAPLTTQLGFLVDASGSIGTPNFNIMRNGYSAAFAALPTDGSIELTVYTFATGTVAVVAPTVITAASLPGILAAVNTMVYTGGITATSLGINAITAAMTGSGNYLSSLSSIINIATDGEPNNSGLTATQSKAAAITAAISSEAAGIDAMTAEGIGSVNFAFLKDLVFSPTNGPCTGCGTLLPDGSTPPNPMTSNPWVLSVNDFNDFPTAINSKVQAIVNPTPEPGILMLMSLGLVGLVVARRNKSA